MASGRTGSTIGIDLGAMGGSVLCGRHNFLCTARGTHVVVGFPKWIKFDIHRFALKLQEEIQTPPPQARRGSCALPWLWSGIEAITEEPKQTS